LQKQFGLGQEQIEALYNYGKMAYDSGRYEDARELLHQYNTYSVNINHIISSTWGQLACEILLQDVRSLLCGFGLVSFHRPCTIVGIINLQCIGL
jgi:hypothetical protein